jgi:hypothetical protein
MSGEIFVTSVYRLDEVLAFSQDQLSAADLHFLLVVNCIAIGSGSFIEPVFDFFSFSFFFC